MAKLDPAECECPFQRTCLGDRRYVQACEEGRGPWHVTQAAAGVSAEEAAASAGKRKARAAAAGANPCGPEGRGPGAELQKILKLPMAILVRLYRVDPRGCGCGCARYARQMDEWGVAGCRERFEEIVEHLRGQAERMGLPFLTGRARRWVQKAIRRAEKREA